MTDGTKLEPLGPISRQNYMKFTIGKEKPREFDIIHITMAQILVANANFISFRKEGSFRLFESDVNWIPNEFDFVRMIDGGLVPCIEFGVNSSRVETSYRFCYKYVAYGNNLKYRIYSGASDEIEFEKMSPRSDRYYLILGYFGKYNWN